jgi:DNA-directed RNA polymerase subunit M/transcription elongation factor TFIIS
MITHRLCKFCPECHSALIRREHRGFIQKYIFKQKPKYKCGNCQAFFFIPLLEKDFREQRKKAHQETLHIDYDKQHEYEEVLVKKKA